MRASLAHDQPVERLQGLDPTVRGYVRSHCGSDAAGFRRYCWRSHSRRIDIQFEKALCECGCFLGVTDENRHNRADRGRQSKPHGLESVVEIRTVLPQTGQAVAAQIAGGGWRLSWPLQWLVVGQSRYINGRDRFMRYWIELEGPTT